MQADDKKKMDEDRDGQEESESANQVDSEIIGERDLDDLVHKRPSGSIKADQEMDADDAVHQRTFSKPPQPSRADPDDLVHGG